MPHSAGHGPGKDPFGSMLGNFRIQVGYMCIYMFIFVVFLSGSFQICFCFFFKTMSTKCTEYIFEKLAHIPRLTTLDLWDKNISREERESFDPSFPIVRLAANNHLRM